MKPISDVNKQLLSAFQQIEHFGHIIARLDSSLHHVTTSGLCGASIGLFITCLRQSLGRTVLVLTDDTTEAENIRDDLDFLMSSKNICFLPEPASQTHLFSDIETIHSFFINDTLRHLVDKKNPVIVASVSALRAKFPRPEIGIQSNQVIFVGGFLDRDSFIDRLFSFGYESVAEVENPLEFCPKGGIIDFFPPDSLNPYRIELYENTVESLRVFNPETQLSINKVTSVTLSLPAHHALAPENVSDIFAYMGDDTIAILLHGERIPDRLPADIVPKINRLNNVIVHNDGLHSDYPFPIKPSPQCHHTTEDLGMCLKAILQKPTGSRCFLFCSNPAQIDRLHALLGLDSILYVVGALSAGFEIPDQNFFLYTEHELFGRRRQTSVFRNLSRDFQIERINPDDVSYGDFMVHANYGIGRFGGLTKIKAFGAIRECLTLEYLGGDRVFVPLDNLRLVTKYRASEGYQPHLYKLGTTEWEKTKHRTRKALEDVSKSLISLYARRISSNRSPFPPDGALQMAVEAEFVYDETPDQITATDEIKRDLESSRPMDRLLCGDVGFGKTEVAIRAAFKVASASKQVAVLVPTTILADQHFATFTSRLKNYPVRVAMLSRFVPAKEQRRIKAELATGDIDIIIGTHRILSGDITFKDLGLLIIDEEHRFGVKAKERLKDLRHNIDVLALSATPIPRSLHFSLIGARDFSVVNTPPKSRLPIFTEVILFDKNLIRNAIQREIDRGGQVYFVHNDIQSIAAMAAKIQEMLPAISVAFAHGQMKEEELESIMRSFINGEIDLLVTTTIIESGIDIANVNTIFINNAHHYGLSQLYQLRGRVGRGGRRAYAYLIVSNPSKVKPEALRKLQTIKRYTALGSGYNIAMKDLEIRGVGNIFGTEQSGNVQAVGYDMYVKILQEALEKTREEIGGMEVEPTKVVVETEVVCPFPSFLPDNYVPSPSIRLDYYRRVSAVTDLDDIARIEKELVDIFGRLPDEASALLEIAAVRVLGTRLGVSRLSIESNQATFTWSEEAPQNNPDLLVMNLRQTASRFGHAIKFKQHEHLKAILIARRDFKLDDLIRFINQLIQSLNDQ